MTQTNNKKTDDGKPRKGRLLALGILLIVTLGAIGLLIYLRSTTPPVASTTPEREIKIDTDMSILLAEPCSPFQKVISDTPLVFNYGYWGFLPEYEQENLDNLLIELILNGESLGQSEGPFELVPTTSLPCVDLAGQSAAFAESGQWAYLSMNYPGLPRGEQIVEIVIYLRERVPTGETDENGDLLYFGPGEVLRITKELLVE